MITAKLEGITTLPKFHSEIRRQQEEHHGEGYCDIHDAITKYMKICESYMELGTNQGGTAAAAMLCKPKEIILIDHRIGPYNQVLKPIAEAYCRDNNIHLIAKECSSISAESLYKTDMLVIDSKHTRDHMRQELTLHSKNIGKYIIAHDTSMVARRPNSVLYDTLEEFANKNQWEVVERGTRNVGYTVIGRTL